MTLLFTFGTYDLYLGPNVLNRRYAIERLDPPNDVHLFLGRWCVVLSKIPPR